MRLRARALAGVVLATALAAAVNLATETVEVARPWWPVAVWVAVVLLVLLTPLVNPVERRAEPPSADEAARSLVADVRRVWQAEAAARGLSQPVPLDVRWSSTGRPVAASRRIVLGRGPEWEDAPLAGGATELVDCLRGLPHRQLVVLGEPGAGKSALAVLLTLGWTTRHHTGDPVPVLLPLASWNPVVEDVEDFVARRTAENHPVDAGVVRRLAREGLLLPVLDGLDELPAVWHGKALERLERWTADRPLVVTCRSAEYERAGVVLSRAAVVEIEPVDVARVVAFLSEPPPARARWAPVLRHLEDEPGSVLAGVLSTPLMVSIARAAYRQPGTDPAGLLALPTRKAVVRTLFDAFLSDAYPAAEPDPTGVRPNRPRSSRPVRWLRYLALQLHHAGTRDWRWEEVSAEGFAPEPERRRFLAVAGVVAGLGAVALLVAALVAHFRSAEFNFQGLLFVQLLIGASVALLLASEFSPARDVPSVLGVALATVFCAGVGAFVALLAAPGTRAAAAAVGLSFVVIDVELAFTRQTGRWLRRVDRPVVGRLFGALWCALAALALRNPAVLGAAVVYPLVASAIPRWEGKGRPRFTPWATRSATRRRVALAVARHGVLAGALVAGAAGWASTPSETLRAVLVAAVCCGANAAYWEGLRGLVWFRCVHVANALQGFWPWRLRAFLDEARDKQVLRQAGTALQFRHALLQQHLEEPLLVERLRTLASRDNHQSSYAKVRLADIMAERGQVDEALDLLRSERVEGTERLAELLAEHRRLDELRELTGSADPVTAGSASRNLARALVAEGDADGAVETLRAAAAGLPGDERVAGDLVRLLLERGRLAELRALTRGEDLVAVAAAVELAKLSADEEVDHVVDFLRGRLEDSRIGAYGGWKALVDLLVNTGRRDEAIDVLRKKAWREAEVERLAGLLADTGRWDELRELAALRDIPRGAHATARLASALAERGDVDEAIAVMRARVERDDRTIRGTRGKDWFPLLFEHLTALLLADLLVEVGRAEEAVAVLRRRLKGSGESTGWTETGRKLENKLVDVLLVLGRRDDAMTLLRTMANRADPHSVDAARRLAEVS